MRALSSTQAPVTQGTWPDRVRHPAWYFRLLRGINCPHRLRARLGNAPTDGWRDPSALRSPKPTMPGGAGRLVNRSIRSSTRPSKSEHGATSGLSTRSQGLCDVRQPALTPAAKPPFSRLTIRRTPGSGIANSGGIVPSDALSTTTTSQVPATTSGAPASTETKRSTSSQTLYLTITTLNLCRGPARFESWVDGSVVGCKRTTLPKVTSARIGQVFRI